MATATVGALRVVLGLDSAAFTDGLKAAQKHLRDVGARMQSVGATMATVGAGMTAAITAPLIAMGFAASKAAQEAADAMGQVEAALVSMGDASGKTKEELAGLADGLMRNSLYDDDDILRKVTANLLTFGRVAGQEFNRAQQAAVDLATRLGTDLQSATMLVGKALNDPVKGMNALSRAGIQLTAAQKDQVKAMGAVGNVAGAQRIILGELEKQFGGAAAAAQKTDPYDGLRDSIAALSESVGEILNKYLTPLLSHLASLADRFNTLSPAMQNFVVVAGVIAAALGPALIAIGAVVSALGTLIAAMGTGGVLAGIGAALAPIAPLILPIAAAVGVAVAAFMLMRDQIEPVLKGLWAELQKTLGPALGDLFNTVKGLITGLAGAWVAFFDSAAGQAIAKFAAIVVQVLGTVVVRTLTALVRVVDGTLKNIGALFSILGDLLTGDFSGAWESMKDFASNSLKMLAGVIEAFVPGAIEWMRKLYDGVKTWLVDKLGDVLDMVGRKVKQAGDFFFWLYDAVVGHSYVPDMVTEIGEWMDRLEEEMVQPAKNATERTAGEFEALRERVAGIFDGLLTDQERAVRQFQKNQADLDLSLAQGGITREQYEWMTRRLNAITPEAPAARPTFGPEAYAPLASPKFAEMQAKELQHAIQGKLDEQADRFGMRFGDAVESALYGDVQGVFEAIFGDLRSILADLGRQLYQAWQGSRDPKGGGFSWSDAGNILANVFGGGKGGFKLPGFATGGSFKVGGSGGIDSKLIAFRATPGEMVDIRRPGQGLGGGATMVHVEPSKYFDVRVAQVAAPGSAAAYQGARQTVPADMAKNRRYTR